MDIQYFMCIFLDTCTTILSVSRLVVWFFLSVYGLPHPAMSTEDPPETILSISDNPITDFEATRIPVFPRNPLNLASEK